MFRPELSKILIVDDEKSVREVVSRKLTKLGYDCVTASDGRAALDLAKKDKYDVVLTDINMPRLDGVGLLSELRKMDETISVIMVTGIMDMDTAIHSLKEGAYDFINKPIESEKLAVSVANALEKTKLLRENIEYQNNLELMVEQRTREVEEKSQRLRSFFVETTMALVSAIEAKDKYTEGHSRRVAEYAKRLAARVGLSEYEAERIYVAGVLHDIGKIGVPDIILHKPGFFDDDEREIMQRHPIQSADILAKIADFKDIMDIVLSHHERFDGKGYPYRMSGESIPMGARILSVADAFDAMTSQRPYRPSLTLQDAIGEIKKERGGQFDPGVADEFLAMIDSGEINNKKK